MRLSHDLSMGIDGGLCQAHMMRFVQEEQKSIEPAFGRWVKGRRAELRLSQADLAAAVSRHGIVIDASAISRIESGDRSVRLAEANAIASALGEVLLSGALAQHLSEGAIISDGIVRLADQVLELADTAERRALELRQLEAQRAEVEAEFAVVSSRLLDQLHDLDALDEDSVNYLIGRIGRLASNDRTRALFDRAVASSRSRLAPSFVRQWEAQEGAARGEYQAEA